MTDRELLELAARAAGMIPLQAGQELDVSGSGGLMFCSNGKRIDWNPLAYDGDALRLAVKLSINFSVDAYPNNVFRQTEVCVGHRCEHEISERWVEHDIEEPWGDSPYVATRRAIVLAAAAIGKEMK